MDGALEDAKGKRFLWGLLLVWSPFFLVILPGVVNAFHGISEQKATGIGAIAGGISEFFATFGFLVNLVFQLTAIVFLARTFSKDRLARGFLSIISIGCSVFILLLSGVSVWLVWISLSHHP